MEAKVKVTIDYGDNNVCSYECEKQLADSINLAIKKELAKCDKTSPETLEILSHDNSFEVRWNVAKNKNTPKDALEKLAYDSELGIAITAIENKNISYDVLLELSNSRNITKRQAARDRLQNM